MRSLTEGDTFDFVTSTVGITLASDLQYEFFVPTTEAWYFETAYFKSLGFDVVPYSSGIASDPDSLDQILGFDLFSFPQVVNDGPTLESILNVSLPPYLAPTVPEPSTWAMMLIGLAGLGFAGYRRARGVLA
jgi:PEP-CTERM motif